MVLAAGKELRWGVGSGAPWWLCGVQHRHVVKSPSVRADQSCLGCRSSRIHHGSVGSVRTHTTVTRAANPTTSSKKTIQPPLGTAFRAVLLPRPHSSSQRFRVRGQDREGTLPIVNPTCTRARVMGFYIILRARRLNW